MVFGQVVAVWAYATVGLILLVAENVAASGYGWLAVVGFLTFWLVLSVVFLFGLDLVAYDDA